MCRYRRWMTERLGRKEKERWVAEDAIGRTTHLVREIRTDKETISL